MLSAARKEQILRKLTHEGQVGVPALAREWGISEDTVRRDLDVLAGEGLLRRVHGGAVPASPAMGDFHVREALSAGEKTRIGRCAAGLVKPGMVVLVDGGTTTRELVRALPRDLNATIVTHSPTIASELIDHGGLEVLVLGGRLFKHSMVAVGAVTLGALDGINADLCFLGATGIHPESGASTGDREEAAVKERMCHAAAFCYLLVSPEKLGAVSPFRIVPAQELQGLVVVAETPVDQVRKFEDLGLRVLRAD